MTNSKLRAVDTGEHGLYIWITGDGRRVSDSEGNTMNIPARRGDLKAMSKLAEAARYYGIMDGHAEFLPNRRRVTDSELEDQKDRLAAGLTPDPYDYMALEEELRIAQTRND